MFKKAIVIVCLVAILGFSFSLLKKSKPREMPLENIDEVQVVEEKLPEKTYTFNIENITDECSESSETLCTVENAVKCTILPQKEMCKNLSLPAFIFMTDSTIERPTEISYRFISKKNLPNNTIEINTDSACNGSWFGLCQGTVIYVLASSQNEKWFVKDIYALE